MTEVGLTPKDWKITKLENILSIGHGKPQFAIEDENGKYPILATGGILGFTNHYLYNKPSVLIGRKGTIDKPQYMDTPFWTVDTLFYTQINEKFNPKFIYYKFHLIDWKRRSEASGVPSLSSTIINQQIISHPDLAEQEKISQALTDADNYISALEKLIEKKKQLKEGLMVNLLTGKQRLKEFAFHEDGTKKGYKDSELGKIPEDWDICILDQVVKLINGRAYALHEWEQAGIPVIRLQNLTGTGEDYYYSNLKLPEKNYCYKGDVLFMWSASFGPYIWKGEKAIFHYHIWKIETVNNVDKYFIYHTLNLITQELKRSASSGGTMLHLTKTFMDKLTIILPSHEEQVAISKTLNDIDKELELIDIRLKKAISIKQGMMQKLLTGEIRFV